MFNYKNIDVFDTFYHGMMQLFFVPCNLVGKFSDLIYENYDYGCGIKVLNFGPNRPKFSVYPGPR